MFLGLFLGLVNTKLVRKLADFCLFGVCFYSVCCISAVWGGWGVAVVVVVIFSSSSSRNTSSSSSNNSSNASTSGSSKSLIKWGTL